MQKTKVMTFDEAFKRELENGRSVLYAAEEEFCQICGDWSECRLCACFDCKQYVRTDGADVWDVRTPEKRWPYVYIGRPKGLPHA